MGESKAPIPIQTGGKAVAVSRRNQRAERSIFYANILEIFINFWHVRCFLFLIGKRCGRAVFAGRRIGEKRVPPATRAGGKASSGAPRRRAKTPFRGLLHAPEAPRLNPAVSMEKRARIRERGTDERAAKIPEEKDDPVRGSRRTHSGPEVQEKASPEMQDLRQRPLAQLLLLPLLPSSGQPPFRGDGGGAGRIRPFGVLGRAFSRLGSEGSRDAFLLP